MPRNPSRPASIRYVGKYKTPGPAAMTTYQCFEPWNLIHAKAMPLEGASIEDRVVYGCVLGRPGFGGVGVDAAGDDDDDDDDS